MRIELVMARGWRMWIDGKPTGQFEIGEDEHGGYSLTGDGLQGITNLKFDVPELDWNEANKPTMAVAGWNMDEKGDPIARLFQVTRIEWGTEQEIKTVELSNGERVMLDEITAYVRLDERMQWWQAERN